MSDEPKFLEPPKLPAWIWDFQKHIQREMERVTGCSPQRHIPAEDSPDDGA